MKFNTDVIISGNILIDNNNSNKKQALASTFLQQALAVEKPKYPGLKKLLKEVGVTENISNTEQLLDTIKYLSGQVISLREQVNELYSQIDNLNELDEMRKIDLKGQIPLVKGDFYNSLQGMPIMVMKRIYDREYLEKYDRDTRLWICEALLDYCEDFRIDPLPIWNDVVACSGNFPV